MLSRIPAVKCGKMTDTRHAPEQRNHGLTATAMDQRNCELKNTAVSPRHCHNRDGECEREIVLQA